MYAEHVPMIGAGMRASDDTFIRGILFAEARPAFQRKVQRYVAETFGKAEHYWNSWCIDRADFYETTPEAMSAIHLEIVR